MTLLARVARTLTGQPGRQVIVLLADQVRAATEGALIARLLVCEGGDTAVARQRLRAVEHAGDECRARLITLLSQTVASPLDREDLFRISRSVDDVLDNLRDFVRQWDLFGMAPCGRFAELLDLILEALRELALAVAMTDRPTTEMTTAAFASRKASNRVRHLYGDALAELLTGEVTMDVLRQRELLRRLDVVGLRLAESADSLTDAAVKRSVL